jgi:hypothetical protein
MHELIRKLRGALGVAATWGAAWGVVFAALSLIIGLIDPDSIDPGEDLVVIVGTGALLGIVSGAAFSALLSVLERGRRIEDLSISRAALWGAMATSVFPLLTPADNSMLLFLCPIGAALAATSIAVVKKSSLEAATDKPALTHGSY